MFTVAFAKIEVDSPSMNGAQLHLALNHFPVVLSIVALAILLWGWFSKNAQIKQVGLVLVIAMATFAAAAYYTGEPAEEVLEKFPAFAKTLVHDHEEAGESAFIISLVAGLAALAALYLGKKKHKFFPLAFLITASLVTITCLAFLNTAHLGGLIRHEEIRTQPPS